MALTAQQLLALDDVEFSRVVEDDMKRANGVAERSALRSAEVVNRWYSTLLGMLQSVNGQLDAREAEYQANRSKIEREGLQKNTTVRDLLQLREDYERKRAGSLRFKTGVETALTKAQYYCTTMFPEQEHVTRERNDLLYRVHELEKAIEEHRHTTLDKDDLEPTEADEELWNLLPTQTVN